MSTDTFGFGPYRGQGRRVQQVDLTRPLCRTARPLDGE
jgi:hypothetical protein